MSEDCDKPDPPPETKRQRRKRRLLLAMEAIGTFFKALIGRR